MRVAAWGVAGAVLALSAGVGGYQLAAQEKKQHRVFELRTYYAHPGKMEALHKRFRDHTCKLFEKHGMELVAFWSPTDPKDAEKRMLYVLAFPDRQAAKKSWDAFANDPHWHKARAASEQGGPLVMKVESVFLTATDYSKLK